jgi:hypothetical protein
MRVTDTRQLTNTIDFGCLDFGDVFQDEDGDICMKIDNHNLTGTNNAVVLTTGTVFTCCTDTPVIPLYAELTINNK